MLATWVRNQTSWVPMHKTAAAKSRRGETLIAIREMILRGELAASKRIEEAELSKTLGASRPAVHTALETLTHEDLVEASPAGGFVARHFTYQDISDAISGPRSAGRSGGRSGGCADQ